MPAKVPTKASGITFYQDTEPSNPSPSDWWYKPSTGELFTLSLTGDFWLEVVSKYVDPYGNSYLHGAVTGETTGISTISVVHFSAEATPSALTSEFAHNNGEGLGLSASEAGYHCGGTLNGWANTQANTIDSIAKFVFANNTTTNNVAHLTRPKQNFLLGQAVNTLAGYVFGGTNENNNETDEIEKYVFAQDTTNTSVVSHLTQVMSRCGGYNSTLAGYAQSQNSSIDKLLFSADTTNASHVADMSIVKSYAGTYNSTLFGYCIGGYTNERISSVERYSFSSDTTNTHTINAVLPEVSSWHNSTMSSRKGYSLGSGSSNAVLAHVFAVDFQNVIHVSDMPVTNGWSGCVFTTSVNNGYLF